MQTLFSQPFPTKPYDFIKSSLKRSRLSVNSTIFKPFDENSRHANHRAASSRMNNFDKITLKGAHTDAKVKYHQKQQQSTQDVQNEYGTNMTESYKQSLLDTSWIEKQLVNNMLNDDKLSTKTKMKLLSKQQYEQKTRLNQIGVGKSHGLPYEVYRKYEQIQAQKGHGHVNFTQGFIPACGLLYYSVQGYLFCYNIHTISEESVPFTLQLNQHVLFYIQNIHIKSKFLSLNQLNQNILIFAYPWKIQFFQFFTTENGLKIQSLNVSLNLHCERPSLFEWCKEATFLYYVDNLGELNSIDTNNYQKYLYFIQAGPLRTQKIKSKHKIQRFYQNCKKIVSKDIKYFFSKFKSSIKSIFTTKMQVAKLIFDKKNSILVSLISIQKNNDHSSPDNKFHQLIRVYNGSQKMPKFVYEIEADTFFEKIRMGNQSENSACIFDIFEIKQSSSLKFNILLVYSNGVRCNLNISLIENDLLYQRVDPPNFCKYFQNIDPLNQKLFHQHSFNIESKAPEKYNEIFAVYSSSKTTILLGKALKRSYSLALFDKNVKQKQNLMNISINEDQISKAKQHYLYQYIPKASKVLKQKQILSICNKQSWCEKKRIVGLQNLHELASQILFLPEKILYVTDYDIRIITILRPIDQLIMVLMNCSYNKQQCINMLNIIFINQEKKQIICMLLQILFDKDGVYFRNRQVERQICSIKASKRMENHSRRDKFYQEDTIELEEEMFHHSQLEIDRINLIKNIVVELALSQFQHSKIINNISYQNQKNIFLQRNHEYSQRNRSQGQKLQSKTQRNLRQRSRKEPFDEKDYSDLIIQAFLLLMSRYFRVIWWKDINQFTTSDIQILNQYFQKFATFFCKEIKQTNSKASKQTIPKINFFFKKCHQLLYLIQSIGKLQSISFSEAISKQPSYYQEQIFVFIKKQYEMVIIQQMKALFPFYMTDQLYKICQLYIQIQNQFHPQQIINICQKVDHLPTYFINCLIVEKKMPEALLLMANQTQQNQNRKYNLEIDEKNKFNSIISKDSFDLNDYQDIMNLIKNETFQLKDKIIMIEHAEKILNYLNNSDQIYFSNYQFTKYHSEVNELTQIIKLQIILIQEYQKQIKFMLSNQKKNVFQRFFGKEQQQFTQKNDYKVYFDKLNTFVLSKENLFTLIVQLKSKRCEVLFQFYFSNNNLEQEKALISLSEEFQTKQQKLSFEEKIKQSANFLQLSTNNTFPVSKILNIFGKSIIKRIETLKMLEQIFSFQKELKINSKYFWLSSFLAENGCKLVDIMKFYEERLAQIFNKDQSLDFQTQYIYHWLCCIIFLNRYSIDLERKLNNKNNNDESGEKQIKKSSKCFNIFENLINGHILMKRQTDEKENKILNGIRMILEETSDKKVKSR